MKYIKLLIICSLFISCNDVPTASKLQEQKSISKDSIVYYKPDYHKEIDTILTSGTKEKSNEFWGVNISEMAKLPTANNIKVDFNKAISFAEQHLKYRFDPIELQFKSIEYEVANKNTSRQFDYIIVTFSYDKKEAFQLVPMLLDGRIISSNNE